MENNIMYKLDKIEKMIYMLLDEKQKKEINQEEIKHLESLKKIAELNVEHYKRIVENERKENE